MKILIIAGVAAFSVLLQASEAPANNGIEEAVRSLVPSSSGSNNTGKNVTRGGARGFDVDAALNLENEVSGAGHDKKPNKKLGKKAK